MLLKQINMVYTKYKLIIKEKSTSLLARPKEIIIEIPRYGTIAALPVYTLALFITQHSDDQIDLYRLYF